ncbi:MAG: elongation factor G [Eubacteriales bacterium]
MADFNTKQIRNLALLGHSGCGKTSLAEAMLYVTKSIDRLGNTTQGNTTCDYDPEAKARGFSLAATPAYMTWKDTKINVIDTPGFLDFTGEVKQAVRVADAAVICVDGKSGVEVGTELAWDNACAAGIPRAFFVNKCDDDETKFGRVFRQLHATFGVSVCPVFIPVETGKDVTMIDLIDMKAFKYDENGKRTEIAMRIGWEHTAAEYKDALNEALAGTSDELMEKFFEGESFTKEESVEALHNGIIEGTIVPVYCGSAIHLWGVVAMLDAIAGSFPRPTARKTEKDASGKPVAIDPEGDPALFVYKTIADPFVGKMTFFKVMSGVLRRDATLRNLRSGAVEKMAHIYIMRGKEQTEVDELACGDLGMVAKLTATNTNDTLSASGDTAYATVKYPTPYLCRALVPESAKDDSKISQSIARMLEEDLTLRFENNPETRQMLIYGIGDMHLAVIASRLKSRFGVNVRLEEPKIAYREMITKSCDVEGKHKKQNGGSGQYGHVKIRFMPGEEEGLTFVDATVGGSVPKNFIPAVEKGLQDAMQKGAVGFPLVRLKAELYDGSYHAVDSDELSFKTAANLAYKKCLELSGPVLLEPVGELSVTVPESLVGDVMGDLNKRRGSVMGMNPCEEKSGYTTVQATAPKSELSDYPISLRAMTQGRGWFDYTVTGYDVVPGNVATKVIAAYQQK